MMVKKNKGKKKRKWFNPEPKIKPENPMMIITCTRCALPKRVNPKIIRELTIENKAFVCNQCRRK
jgi:hypothetical protein